MPLLKLIHGNGRGPWRDVVTGKKSHNLNKENKQAIINIYVIWDSYFTLTDFMRRICFLSILVQIFLCILILPYSSDFEYSKCFTSVMGVATCLLNAYLYTKKARAYTPACFCSFVYWKKINNFPQKLFKPSYVPANKIQKSKKLQD